MIFSSLQKTSTAAQNTGYGSVNRTGCFSGESFLKTMSSRFTFVKVKIHKCNIEGLYSLYVPTIYSYLVIEKCF